MKTETKYDTVTCIICHGSGKIPELKQDGNGYFNNTGRNTSCDQCGGRGKVDKPYKLMTFDSDEFRTKVKEYEAEKQWLRNQISIEKQRKGKPWGSETSRYDVDALEDTLKNIKYPERSYREDMPYYWGRSVESRRY